MKSGAGAVIIVFLILCSASGWSQTAQEDSSFYQSALANSKSFYYKQLGDQSLIYNGSIYPPLPFSFREGSAFFLSDKPVRGSVVYDGVLFSDIPLLYDDYRQFLITVDQGFQLQLVNEKIRSFTMDGHHFEYLAPDNLHKGLSGSGFYEILYDGPSKVVKRTYKKINEKLSVSEGVVRSVDVTVDYFIRKNNLFEIVNSKSELLNRMNNHRKEIQRFMRKSKLNFRKDRDHTLALTAAYFDQLAD